MERQQKITFLLNKIKDTYEKINEHAKEKVDVNPIIACFERKYNKLEECHLDNIIKSNGFKFYTTKQYRAIA